MSALDTFLDVLSLQPPLIRVFWVLFASLFLAWAVGNLLAFALWLVDTHLSGGHDEP